ncbi:acetyl/propionyl/methylcrotonyl-CoA carboxylase subunit alpha [Parvularcula sp. LCG005]|uniref:acetyl/propionyl/methylcrotonyl-CoA carboxylase subunit alpha n=1 Tax=Parvularcula sp. LCG005 TaxID=3078805 RepID=UPI002942422D|nr:biotin carboxylase N-terminal domain-containing protein [Parvularcula sp. LCG005]WOI54558.1 biotin carboxylase N-terminal domain-containing protein [Parvularcula sp. LCG005]
MFKSLLIANRGEIAVRVAKTAKRMGLRTIAVYSDIDIGARHTLACDEAVALGGATAAESYLVQSKIIDAAKRTGAEAIHPGYGFLSENAEFAEAVEAAGLIFVGPTAETIRAMGSKSAAKDMMERAGVPITPGYQGDDQSAEAFSAAAEKIGYPVLLKASAGGGGKGMRLVREQREMADALAAAKREAKSAFGDDFFLMEKYIETARHVEVQIFGDGRGDVVHVFERDCSLQRRHQKVIEEAPAPNLPASVRKRLLDAGVNAGKAVDYRGAGTVEFLYDGADDFYFMEMNTRLQVEHPVSEMISGLDFVEWQLRIAADEGLPAAQNDITENGHAFEARIYAENPYNDFSPSTGFLDSVHLPHHVARVDHGVEEGQEVSPYYDPMIAKIITHAGSRGAALGQMRQALLATRIAGLETNTRFLHDLAAADDFIREKVNTRFIEDHAQLLSGPGTVPDMAMIAAAIAQQPAFFADPTKGFRLNAPSKLVLWLEGNGTTDLCRFEYRSGDWTMSVEPGATAANRREGQQNGAARSVTFQILQQSDDMLRLRMGDRDRTAHVAKGDAGVRVWIDADHWDIAHPNPLVPAADQGASAGSLTAPMPGLITLLVAEEGASVAAGDALLVMEAMKMEHTIRAPADGVVKAFRFAVGDQVKEGDFLVELSTEDE